MLLVDSPNLDRQLKRCLGRPPTMDDRPRWDVLKDWFLAQSGEGEIASAGVFLNYPTEEDKARRVDGWLNTLHLLHYGIYIRQAGKGDIDDAMCEQVRLRYEAGEAARIFIISHDGRNWVPALKSIAQTIPVTVICFPEHAASIAACEEFRILDLEYDLPGVLPKPLTRRLRVPKDIPEAGTFINPFWDIGMTAPS